MFKRYVYPIRKPDGTFEKDTGCFEDEFINSGIFHQWVSNYEEFETGAGNFTVGIVELPNGTIEQVLPQHIQFLDTDKIKL